MSDAQKSEIRRYLFRFVLRPTLDQKRSLVYVFLALAIMASSQALAVIFSKGFLTAFFTDPKASHVVLTDLLPKKLASYIPAITSMAINRDDVVWLVPLCIFSVGLLKAISSYTYNLGLSQIALKVAQNYRERIFEAVLKLPWQSSASRSAGDWMTVIMADAMFIQTRLTDVAVAFVKDFVLIVSCMLTLAFVHAPAAVALLFLSPIIAWQMGRTGRRIAWFAEAFQKELGSLAALLLGIRERFRYMRAQHGEAVEIAKYTERNRAYLAMMTGSIFIRSIVAPGMEWAGFLIFAVFIYGWSRGLPFFEIAPDVVLQFFVALGLILKPVRELGEQFTRLGETIGGIKRSMSVVSLVEASTVDSMPSHHLVSGPDRQKQIFIKKFMVGYSDISVLKGNDLHILFGSCIAIVGPSGSGKSSLLRVLSGLLPPREWESNVEWQDLRRMSAMVSQSPFLFKDSLRKNLLYSFAGDSQEITDESQLWRSLATVNLEATVRELPEGLDSIFDPLDSNLSGGQIQRLVIARALLRNPKIILLDEATSAVDVASEIDITRRLIEDAKTSGRILLSVTHRLQWLSLYDQIWFVEDGQIQKTGSFEDLSSSERFRAFLAAEQKS